MLGLDPAGKPGGVTVFKLSGGELYLDGEPWQHTPTKLDEIARQFMDYQPRGNPLPDKGNTKLHGLHLEDYQPRSHEHGVQRVTFERAYPELPEYDAEDMYMRRSPSTEWVDYRSRSPLRPTDWVLPPMRDALADLIEHLHMVHTKLAEQDLVAVEVSVQHEPTPSKPDGSGQGWNFAVHTVAVPQAVLDAEEQRYRFAQAKLTAPDGA